MLLTIMLIPPLQKGTLTISNAYFFKEVQWTNSSKTSDSDNLYPMLIRNLIGNAAMSSAPPLPTVFQSHRCFSAFKIIKQKAYSFERFA